MLNISNNVIGPDLKTKDLRSFQVLNRKRSYWLYLLIFCSILFVIVLFLPWTQSVRAKGYVTTQQPDQRPQTIQSVISGRLEKWYVKEGDYVNKGDTIVYISEVKSEYFDPNLIERTKQQVEAKESSIENYKGKSSALGSRYSALIQSRNLKTQQTFNKIRQKELKIVVYSNDLIAMESDAEIAENQYDRTIELHKKGLKSLTDLEAKRLKQQNTQAKVASQKNKIRVALNEVDNLRISLNAIQSEYADKLAKAQSDRYSSETARLDATANASKLKNKLSNYNERKKYYYVTAPQSGQITKSIKKGIGEIIKEGGDVATIMPANYDLAVELYIKPIDLPLLVKGEKVLLQFDGWPAIAFSGWPSGSTGTFMGEIMVIDQFVSDDDKGKYRILVKPSTQQKKPSVHSAIWPKLLRVGSGSKAFILLKDVPIWFELWRTLNGFPPNFYEQGSKKEKVKTKVPLKKVK